MSQGRILAIAFIVVGVVLVLVAALADQIGFGAPGSTFGWKQLVGVVVGIGLIAGGVVLLRQGDVEYEDDDEDDDEVEDEAEGRQ